MAREAQTKGLEERRRVYGERHQDAELSEFLGSVSGERERERATGTKRIDTPSSVLRHSASHRPVHFHLIYSSGSLHPFWKLSGLGMNERTNERMN